MYFLSARNSLADRGTKTKEIVTEREREKDRVAFEKKGKKYTVRKILNKKKFVFARNKMKKKKRRKKEKKKKKWSDEERHVTTAYKLKHVDTSVFSWRRGDHGSLEASI